MLFSSFSTRSMVFAYFAKAQLPFSLFRDLFNDTAEFTLCYGLHDCSHLFQGYFIHSLSTLYYYNAPSLTTRLTGDYRDRTYTGKCSPALLDTHEKNGHSLVSLILETGRTHQIRIHMKHLGYPLIGDYLYNPDMERIQRQALHAWKLIFRHPITGEILSFTAPLPKDMAMVAGDTPWSIS